MFVILLIWMCIVYYHYVSLFIILFVMYSVVHGVLSVVVLWNVIWLLGRLCYGSLILSDSYCCLWQFMEAVDDVNSIVDN